LAAQSPLQLLQKFSWYVYGAVIGFGGWLYSQPEGFDGAFV
jgi:hypothetical protein